MVLTTVPQTALMAQAEEAGIESIDTASEAEGNTASEQITTEGGRPEDTEEPVTVEADAPEATVDAESVAEVVGDDTTVDEEPVVNGDDASDIMPMGYVDNNAAFAYGTGDNVAAEGELTVAFTKGVDTDGKLTSDVATDGIEFTVEPQSGVTLSNVEAVYGINTETPVEDQNVTMTAPAEGATTWTGKIEGSALSALADTGVTGKTVTITITATKEVEAVTHDVTVTATLPDGVTNVADVITVTSVTDSTTEEVVTFEGTTAKVSLEEGKTLGLKVELGTDYQTGYEVTVAKGEDVISAVNEVYPIADAENKADVAVTITVTKEVVGEITDLASAKTAVQKAIGELTFTNAEFENDALTETETKILTAATTALSDSDYTATVKTALAVNTAATEQTKGEAAITLTIAHKTTTTDTEDVEYKFEIPVKEPEGEKQTIEQAKKLVEDAVKAADIKVTNEDDASDDTRKAVADKILAEAQKAELDENFAVAVKQSTAGTDDKLVITKATEEAAGKAAITLVITDSTPDAATKTLDVPIELAIAQLQKTAANLDEVAAAVEAAVKAADIKVTNADVADDAKKETVAGQILAAAKTAKYDETKFDITRKETTAGTPDKLEVVNATANANGSAKLTLVVAEKTAEAGKEPQKKEVAITLTVTMQGATTITINDSKAIEQKAGTQKEYTIAADGALDNTVDYDRTVLRAWISGDKLVIRTNAVATNSTANVTVYAQGNKEVYGTVAVTVKDFFDETTAAPTVKAGEIQGDAELNVILSSTVEDYVSGEVGYEVTATAKNQESADFPEKLARTETVYVPRTGDSDEAKITLGNIGDGAKWDYEVTAKLVHGYYRYNSFNELSSSKPSTAVTISTVESKDMTFTSALKLKKEKIAGGNLYTGQSSDGILIATANFDQIAKYQVIGYAEDQYEGYYNNYDEYEGPQWLDLKVAGNKIYVTNVPETARLGKHTITVYASTDRTFGHEAYEARATVVVNVVKGINSLNVVQSSESIYKKDNTKATFKLTPDFNHDDVGQPDSESTYRSTDGKKWVTAPKSKKVEWSLVGANTAEPVEITGVSVNKTNGTVTLEKTYKPDATNNKFKVKVVAKDFEGNDVSAVSKTITVTSTDTDISKLVITDSSRRVVAEQVDKKPISVKAEDIDGGYVYALPANATVGDKGSTLDTTQAFPVENLTIKSNNAKVLSLDGNQIDIKAAGKKVTISVAANDGSKKKNSVTLDLGYSYDEKAGLGLSIYNYSTEKYICEQPAADATEIKTEVTAGYDTPGTADLRVVVWAAQPKEAPATGYSFNNAALTNYKLTVKGGKIVKSNANGYVYEVATNAKDTILTLTDTSVKSGKKPTYVYKLTNTAYNATDKAKVKVKNSLYAYSDDEQTVDMSVLDSANKAFGADKKVMVDVDWAAMTTKNEWMLNELSSQIKGTYTPDKDGGITLSIYNEDRDSSFTAGSYKLRVTVGTESTNQETGVTTFTATTQSATATLKVVKNKKFTFKPTTTYSISKADGAAILTGKSNVNAKQGEKVNVHFDSLQNVIDKTTGKANKFTHYFTIQYDAQNHTYKLALNTNDDLIKEILTGKKDLKTAIDKKDLTGYISYNAWPNVGYYDNDDLYGTVKITVKTVADAAADKPAKFGSKYTASKPEIALTAGSRAWVNIMNGAEYVNVADVALDTRTGKKNSADIDLLGTNDRGQIVLKANKALTNKANHAVNLLVVPESSVYLDDISTAPDDAARKKLFEQYGVPVKVTIKAMEKPALTPHPGTAQETLDDAVSTVTEALNRADGWVQITNDDVANTDKQKEVTQWILDTVERLLDENYTAVVKEGSTLEVVQATKDKEGSAQITLVVTDNSLEATNPNRTMEAAISIPIPKLKGGDTPAPEEKTVTVTVDTPANVSSLSYSIDNGEDTPINSIAASNEILVESGKALSLKVTAAAGKTVTVTVGGEKKEPTGGSYAIGTIDANITVAITTADVTPVTEYTVTVTGTVEDIATITYSIKDGAQNQSVTLDADTGKATFKVADGKELSLAVTAATGKKVDSVTYGASSTATEENGAYSIGAITADTEITIATSAAN